MIDTLINDKFNDMSKTIISIEHKIMSSNKSDSNIEIENLRELKNESISEIDKKDILKALNYKDYRSIIYLFRLYYKNKTNDKYVYPIKIKGVRSFEYYNTKKWNPDLYEHHSMNVICVNFQD